MPFVPNHMVGTEHGRTHDWFFSVPSIIVIEVAKIYYFNNNSWGNSMIVVEGTEKDRV